MIPSTLAAEVSGVLRDFLSTGFGPSNPAPANGVKDFLDDPDILLTNCDAGPRRRSRAVGRLNSVRLAVSYLTGCRAS